jgi:hypothetical protein
MSSVDLSRNTVLAKSEDGAADLGVPMPYLESAGDDVRRRGQIVKVLSQYAHHRSRNSTTSTYNESNRIKLGADRR